MAALFNLSESEDNALLFAKLYDKSLAGLPLLRDKFYCVLCESQGQSFGKVGSGRPLKLLKNLRATASLTDFRGGGVT